MEQSAVSPRQHSNSYNIFILVLTVFSLLVMVALLLPLEETTIRLLQGYDTLICIIFLADFFVSLRAAPNKSDYFIKQRGWLDLLGSIPSFGVFKFTAILRLARISRLVRIVRMLRGENRGALLRDILRNRNQYAGFITILLAIIVLATSSVLVLQFESKSPDANIKSGWDALWYAMVTITTVGYGDRYPVTIAGRITGMFIMFTGVGIIGALASILASLLVGSPAGDETQAADLMPAKANELEEIKNELAELRRLIEKTMADK